MAAVFVKQPNSLLARFHTGSDQFTHWNLTPAEAVEVIVEHERREAERFIARVVADETSATWAECVEAADGGQFADELAQVISDANS